MPFRAAAGPRVSRRSVRGRPPENAWIGQRISEPDIDIAAMGQPVENTLHDLRWGDVDRSGTVDDYVWVFLISGSAPPAHFINGWAGASSERQPYMYFRLGHPSKVKVILDIHLVLCSKRT